MKFQDLSGRKFGRLIVLGIDRSLNGKLRYKCLCDCGNEVIVFPTNLKRGNTKSCGCVRIETILATKKKHGEKNTKLYGVWCGIRSRCNNPNNKEYHRYGGRGINVCDEWSEFVNFREWAYNNGYSENLSIDRIDNNGDYCPSNCKWSNRYEQANNTSTNVFVEYNCQTHTLSEWAKMLNLNYKRLHRAYRNYGYSFEKSIEYAKTE